MCMLQGAVNNAGGKCRITIGYEKDKFDSSVCLDAEVISCMQQGGK
jgi:hypothetical protein